MKTLIAEDDFVSRLLMQEILKSYGPLFVVVNGKEAVEAVRLALVAKEPFSLICLDIMMPELDGQAALMQIRELEKASGIQDGDGAKVIMTTALDDVKSVGTAYKHQCDAYLTKPINQDRLFAELRKMGLIP